MSAANQRSQIFKIETQTPDLNQYHIPEDTLLVYRGQEIDDLSDVDLENGSYTVMAVEAEDSEAEGIKEILNGENVLGAIGENIERLDYVINQLTEPQEDVIQVTTKHPNYEILVEEYENNQLIERKKAENYIEGSKAIQASINQTDIETLELMEKAGLQLEEIQETKQELQKTYKNQKVPEKESNKLRETLKNSKETIEKLRNQTNSRISPELLDEIRALDAGLEMTEAEINNLLNNDAGKTQNLGEIL